MFIHRTKKLIAVSIGGLAILGAASFFGYQAYANDASKTEMLKQMEEEYQKLAEQDDPNAPSEERQKIKDLGWEIGKLKKELYPENPEDVLARKLAGFKEMTLIHESSYKNSDADANDPEVTKMLAQIEQQKQLVAKFEEKLASLKNRAKMARQSEDAKEEAEQLLAQFQQEKEAISTQSDQ